jgi:hypothetical protein
VADELGRVSTKKTRAGNYPTRISRVVSQFDGENRQEVRADRENSRENDIECQVEQEESSNYEMGQIEVKLVISKPTQVSGIRTPSMIVGIPIICTKILNGC